MMILEGKFSRDSSRISQDPFRNFFRISNKIQSEIFRAILHGTPPKVLFDFFLGNFPGFLLDWHCSHDIASGFSWKSWRNLYRSSSQDFIISSSRNFCAGVYTCFPGIVPRVSCEILLEVPLKICQTIHPRTSSIGFFHDFCRSPPRLSWRFTRNCFRDDSRDFSRGSP